MLTAPEQVWAGASAREDTLVVTGEAGMCLLTGSPPFQEMTPAGTRMSRARLGNGVGHLYCSPVGPSPSTPFPRRSLWGLPKSPPSPGPHRQVGALRGTPHGGRGSSRQAEGQLVAWSEEEPEGPVRWGCRRGEPRGSPAPPSTPWPHSMNSVSSCC